jgi:hypothetical protein
MISKVAGSNWRTAALMNYMLVSMQYPCIAINPSLRRHAIKEISAFIALKPHELLTLRQCVKE